MINSLGFVLFGTIVGIGLLDRRSGLSVFAMYRPTGGATGIRWWVPSPERRGDGNQPTPPAPAR